MAMSCEVIEQLHGYQMNLTEIWSAWIAASEVTMTDMLSRMCIALYAVAFDEMDHFAAGLAETVSRVAGYRHHCASELFHLVRALRPLWRKSVAFDGSIA